MFRRRKVSLVNVGPIMLMHGPGVSSAPNGRPETEQMLGQLRENASEMERCLEDITLEQRELNADWASAVADDDEGDEDSTSVPAEKLAGWEIRKAKYKKYAEKGKVLSAPMNHASVCTRATRSRLTEASPPRTV